jgi:hypothetical protein
MGLIDSVEWIEYNINSKTVTVKSYDLQNPRTLEYYRAQGFHWIRRSEQPHYNLFMRDPTIGCFVELKTHRDLRCAHLDTPKAKKLIRTQSYFTSDMYI